jgi:hypothetical protein
MTDVANTVPAAAMSGAHVPAAMTTAAVAVLSKCTISAQEQTCYAKEGGDPE